MKTASEKLLLLVFAIALMLCTSRTASAQVTGTDLQTFLTSVQSLISFLQTNANNDPNTLALVNNLQAAINNLTPAQMVQVASNYNIPAFSNAVNTLVTIQPTPRKMPPIDPPANLFNPNFLICQLAQNVGVPVPSDPGTIKALDVSIFVAQEAATTADRLCNAVVAPGTTVPQCAIATVLDLIAEGLERARDLLTFCDPVVRTAEIEAAWQNTITTDVDLANHDTNITTRLTNLENHLTQVDSDVINHTSSTDTDVDAHIAAVDVDLNNHLANVDADLNNHITSTDSDLNTHLTGVDTDVLNRATQIDNEISTFQTLDLRLKIEHALAAGLTIGLFEVPTAQGGYLDLVRSIVVDTINKVLASGGTVGTASKSLTSGDTAKAAGQFKSAYSSYMSAYQAAVH
jgi:hypothetical protein